MILKGSCCSPLRLILLGEALQIAALHPIWWACATIALIHWSFILVLWLTVGVVDQDRRHVPVTRSAVAATFAATRLSGRVLDLLNVLVRLPD